MAKKETLKDDGKNEEVDMEEMKDKNKELGMPEVDGEEGRSDKEEDGEGGTKKAKEGPSAAPKAESKKVKKEDDEDWEDDFTTRRSITYSMQFTAKSYIYGPYSKADVIRKSRIIETIGDTNVGKRHVELSYTPKAKTDINQDGQVTAADDALVTADDDFGFNEGMNFL